MYSKHVMTFILVFMAHELDNLFKGDWMLMQTYAETYTECIFLHNVCFLDYLT